MPCSTRIGVRRSNGEESHTAEESGLGDPPQILFTLLESVDFCVKLHGTLGMTWEGLHSVLSQSPCLQRKDFYQGGNSLHAEYSTLSHQYAPHFNLFPHRSNHYNMMTTTPLLSLSAKDQGHETWTKLTTLAIMRSMIMAVLHSDP